MNFKLLGVGVGIFLLGLVLGAGLYRRFAPAKVEFKDREVTKVVEKEGKVEVREVAGPVRVETKTVVKTVPGPERPGPTVERIVTRVETRDPVTVDRHSDTVTESASKAVTVTLEKPLADPPGWTLGAGLQLRPDQELQIEVGRRIIGPVWLTAWAMAPMRLEVPALGVGVRVELP